MRWLPLEAILQLEQNEAHIRQEKNKLRTFSSARLDDEDILSSDALFNLNPRLAALELVQQYLCRRYAEVVADSSVG
jgi:hypothetical protein